MEREGRQQQPRPLPPSRRTGRAGRAVGQLAEIKEFPSAQVGQQVGQRPTRPAGSVGVAFQQRTTDHIDAGASVFGDGHFAGQVLPLAPQQAAIRQCLCHHLAIDSATDLGFPRLWQDEKLPARAIASPPAAAIDGPRSSVLPARSGPMGVAKPVQTRDMRGTYFGKARSPVLLEERPHLPDRGLDPRQHRCRRARSAMPGNRSPPLASPRPFPRAGCPTRSPIRLPPPPHRTGRTPIAPVHLIRRAGGR